MRFITLSLLGVVAAAVATTPEPSKNTVSSPTKKPHHNFDKDPIWGEQLNADKKGKVRKKRVKRESTEEDEEDLTNR